MQKVMIVVIALIVLVMASQVFAAAPEVKHVDQWTSSCYEPNALENALAADYGEKPVWFGFNDTHQVGDFMFVNAESRTYTLVRTYKKFGEIRSCIIGSGNIKELD